MLDKNKVAVGMSGGVDSSVSAYLLKQKGYEVIGLTMKLFKEYDEFGNEIESDFIKDAKRICSKLSIEHYVVDLTREFKEKVINYFVDEYSKGLTPNPCVVCNKYIKYGKLLEASHNKGAYYLATGHYAKIVESNGIYRILSGKNDRKDQGYLLNQLSQYTLKHLLLPLSDYNEKAEVRKIAKEIELEISSKKDSLGICFINGGDYRKYLGEMFKNKDLSGKFIDKYGKALGQHDGFYKYTIGQKKKFEDGSKKYVISINPESKDILLGDDIETYFSKMILKDVNFTDLEYFKEERVINIKVCQWGYLLKGIIRRIGENKYGIEFLKPERAIAKGQYAVFYRDNEILGGGYIEETFK